MILVLCTGGVVYEFVNADSLYGFFGCTGVVEGVFRSFKYLRLMVLILNSTIFKEARLIFISIFRSLYTIRHMVLVWLLIVLTFSIIGYHLHSNKTKINPVTQKLDLQSGISFQVSFDGIF